MSTGNANSLINIRVQNKTGKKTIADNRLLQINFTKRKIIVIRERKFTHLLQYKVDKKTCASRIRTAKV